MNKNVSPNAPLDKSTIPVLRNWLRRHNKNPKLAETIEAKTVGEAKRKLR
jgi:hypothetical protein